MHTLRNLITLEDSQKQWVISLKKFLRDKTKIKYSKNEIKASLSQQARKYEHFPCKEPCWSSVFTSKDSQLPLTLAAGNPTFFSELCGHLHSCTHKNKSFKLYKITKPF